MDLRRVFGRASGNSSSKKSEKDSLFLAVKISSTSVLATVWTIDSGKVSIGQVGSAPLAERDYEHLLKSCDRAISQASSSTAPNVEKAIFAVPHGWVIDGKIVPEHLQNLRRICKELDLVPLGYVVTIEALENFYKEVEGAPLTAILIGIDEERSVLTIFRAGKDLGTVTVDIDSANDDQIAPAIESAIKKFSHIEALPSRIILYNSGSDLDPIAQKITAYPWTGKLPFLHFPKVENAPAEFVIKAVAAAGGIQMGASLDAQELTPSRQQHRSEVPTELEEVSPEEAGFVTQSDFHEISIPMSHNETPPEEFLPPSFSEITPSPRTDSVPFPKSEKKLNLSSVLKNNMQKLSKITGIFRGVSWPEPKKFPIVMPIFVAALIAVVGIFGAIIYIFPKATLLITVSAKNFSHEMSVGIITSETVNTAGKSIPGSFVDVSEIGTRKSAASGQKLVGNKAKGSVTIYGVSDSKKFSANTTLTSPNGLKFTLDSDTTVASGDAVTPATATVAVHGAEIGDPFNLPAGTKFIIGNLSSSDYLAKNDASFSGGNSHQATVVTKLDQDRLMSTLSAQLAKQAKSDLQSKLGSFQTLLPNAITSTVSKKKFSKEIDDESDSISLDLTMDFRAVVFSKEDVIKLFADEFAYDIPQGYSLNSQNTSVKLTDAKTDKNGNATLALSVNGNLAPEINTADIVNQVSGKSYKSASDYISKLPGVSNVSLSASPSQFEPILNVFLPWKKDNLKIEVVTQ